MTHSASGIDYHRECRMFQRMLSLHQRFAGDRNPDELLPLLTQEIAEMLGADRGTVFLVDWDRRELRSRYAMGVDGDDLVIPFNLGVVGLCFINQTLLNIGDAYQLPLFNTKVDTNSGYRTETILVIPFGGMEDGIEAGAVQLLNKIVGRFTPEDEEILRRETLAFCHQCQTGKLTRDNARSLIDRLRRKIGCERGSVFIMDRERYQLVSLEADGMDDLQIRLDLNVGVAGYVALTGQTINIADTASSRLFNTKSDLTSGYRTRNLLCVPMTSQSGEMIGVMEVMNKLDGPLFTYEDQVILSSVAASIAILLENSILLLEHDRQFKSLLEVLAASIDAKDPLTAGHSMRVAEYAVGIAKELDFNPQEIDVLQVAALLHDYGKLGIEDEVLKKPGKLTTDEYSRIKQHVDFTLHILEKIHFSRKYRHVPFIAAAHHEHMDGSGYAVGLRGREIPFMTKIITVADIFEALTADRHYRPAMPIEKAFAILEEGAGIKFDQIILDALLRYWETRPTPKSDPSV